MTKPKRKALSKKNRFEVFKRDSFSCQYCGQTPPSVVLEIDHISPLSKGGSDDVENMVTACFDCNRGKGARLLSSVPEALHGRTDEMIERESQLKEYTKLMRAIKSRKTRAVNAIEAIFTETFGDYSFKESFKASIKNSFLEKLDIETLKDNMGLACSKGYEEERTLKYFCGICWRMIKGTRIV